MPPIVVVEDLAAEYDDLDGVLAGLSPKDWDAPTPAAGWSVRDQVAHLAFSEELATLAATDAPNFGVRLDELLADLAAAEQEPRARAAVLAPDELRDWWCIARTATLDALLDREATDRIPWIAGEMSAASFATARLMETWAHGQDIADAVGRDRHATDRVRHIAHLGVRTRSFSYVARGRVAPDTPVRVELTLPSGAPWSAGPQDAPDCVTGPAEDFCLVVTQRRHPRDTALVIEGDAAREWMAIAQAFAGPPTDQRQARADR